MVAAEERRDTRGGETRLRIFAATVKCLDQLGYAETSIGRIQDAAKVSRGALTHHFPTRQTLIAATATHLLNAAARPLKSRAAEPVATLLSRSWETIVDTPEGRAMVEILVACRTDRTLEAELKNALHLWDRQISEEMEALYRGADGDGDAALLWSITRAFIRGLLIHERFVDDPDHLRAMVIRFSRLLEAEMLPRPLSSDP